jgi:hypothetical protein
LNAAREINVYLLLHNSKHEVEWEGIHPPLITLIWSSVAVALLAKKKCSLLIIPLTPRPSRHTLASEPEYFRKELHFFDQDHRYVRGLRFYAAHFPTCARDDVRHRQYLTAPPEHGVEVMLHEARSGQAIGWDADLNTVTTTPSSFLLLPMVAGSVGAGSLASYALLDATSGRTLFLKGGFQLAVSELPPIAEPATRFHLRFDGGQAVDLVDTSTLRRLHWANRTMQVEPAAKSGEGAWKLLRQAPPCTPPCTTTLLPTELCLVAHTFVAIQPVADLRPTTPLPTNVLLPHLQGIKLAVSVLELRCSTQGVRDRLGEVLFFVYFQSGMLRCMFQLW